MSLLIICDRIIEYSFYALFLFVPLVFTSITSELFELNKMWLTWALTIIIVTAWIIKMVLQRKIIIQRTPIDIPIILFLVSQIISTIFSLDSHVSFWGYYSRFNGGLLSTITYIFLYYAFVSNLFSKTIVYRLITISLISGFIVALWGLPSHYGYDPTCFIFRGTLDVSCWTADFIPKARIFSTLGQPVWLAAYLAILIPIAIAYFLNKQKSLIINHLSLILIALFYVDLLFTQARSGILGLWISLIFFAFAYFWFGSKTKLSISLKTLKSLIINPLSLIIALLLLITFIIGTPISQLNNFTFPGLKAQLAKTKVAETPEKQNQHPQAPQQQSVAGGTESGEIRLFVWKGALDAWKSSPIFGTGVETFAYAYYKYKPAGQNLTSEWNFLYNKAHNEYLNYLTTTGIFGLGSYLGMIGYVLFLSLKQLKTQMSKLKSRIQNEKLSALSYSFELCILSFALVASYISILVTNFFGFSVVITNIYLFMIPAFVFVLNNMIKDGLKDRLKAKDQSLTTKDQSPNTSIWQYTPIFFIGIIGLYMLIMLFRFWKADAAYALGYNLNRVGEYQKANQNLREAIQLRPSEPVFKDEFSVNSAAIATALLTQKDQGQAISAASSYATDAINTSNEIISKYPNNASFWKTRVRVFYTLSQIDSRYLPRALDAITNASLLAPQDANILYNLGVLYGQNGDITKGIEALEKTVKLKPDYRDARYALGLFYREIAFDKDGKVKDSAFQKKAISEMRYILDRNPQDPGALESVKNWEK